MTKYAYTAEEIRTMYRDAKYKDKMLKEILPDLTLKSTRELEKIIFDKNEDLAKPKRNRSYVPVREYERIAELTSKGLSKAEIAEELNYTEAAVTVAVIEMARDKTSAKGKGLARKEENEIKRAPVTEELKNKICELRRSGKAPTKIADEVELNKSTVWKILKEAGLTNPPNGLQPKQKEERKENRMRQLRNYYCELCGEQYDTKKEAEECADRHIDLSEFEAEQIYEENKDIPVRIIFTKGDGAKICYELPPTVEDL